MSLSWSLFVQVQKEFLLVSKFSTTAFTSRSHHRSHQITSTLNRFLQENLISDPRHGLTSGSFLDLIAREERKQNEEGGQEKEEKLSGEKGK